MKNTSTSGEADFPSDVTSGFTTSNHYGESVQYEETKPTTFTDIHDAYVAPSRLIQVSTPSTRKGDALLKINKRIKGIFG